MLRRTWDTDNYDIQSLLITCGESFNAPSSLTTWDIPPRDINQPPTAYLKASSYGQTITLLAKLGRLPGIWHISNDPSIPSSLPIGSLHNTSVLSAGGSGEGSVWLQIPEASLFAAASEHSLRQAYRGTLPGIDPTAFEAFRLGSKSHAYGLKTVISSLQWYLSDNTNTLPLSSTVTALNILGGQSPSLLEASAKLGVSTLSGSEDQTEVTLYGTPEAVDAFTRVWSPVNDMEVTFVDVPNGIAKAKKKSA